MSIRKNETIMTIIYTVSKLINYYFLIKLNHFTIIMGSCLRKIFPKYSKNIVYKRKSPLNSI